jgi:hypothetical protein
MTVEDAMWLRRMASAGETLTATLAMEARLEGEADSANVIAELRGSEKPTFASALSSPATCHLDPRPRDGRGRSRGDTLDKVEPADLQRATFMLAVMGYVLADMPGRLAP